MENNSDKNRTKTRVAVYLIGMRGKSILLGKRQNVAHMNGYWSLVAGHAYEGEPCTHAILREVKEECGLELTSEELSLIGAMHHYSHPFDYVSFIFRADLSNHAPINTEPEKCELLEFHPLEKLPEPMPDYILEIIKKSVADQSLWISEFGWRQ